MPPRTAPPQRNTLDTMFSSEGRQKKYCQQIGKYVSNLHGETLKELSMHPRTPLSVAEYTPTPLFEKELCETYDSMVSEYLKSWESCVAGTLEPLHEKQYFDLLREVAAEHDELKGAIHLGLRTLQRTGEDLVAFGPGLVFTDPLGNNVWSTGEDMVIHWNTSVAYALR